MKADETVKQAYKEIKRMRDAYGDDPVLKDNVAAIPLAFLKPLANSEWGTDEYQITAFWKAIVAHHDADIKYGGTCYYGHADRNEYHPLSDFPVTSVTSKEFAEMKNHIPPDFVEGEYFLNQHYEHSLLSFYSEVYLAWKKHLKRTDAIIGTPHGKPVKSP